MAGSDVRNRAFSRVAVLLVVVLLVAAACGDGDDASTTTSGGDDGTATTGPPPAESVCDWGGDNDPGCEQVTRAVLGQTGDTALDDQAADFVAWRREQFIGTEYLSCGTALYSPDRLITRLPIDEALARYSLLLVGGEALEGGDQIGGVSTLGFSGGDPLDLVQRARAADPADVGLISVEYALSLNPGWKFGPGGEPIPVEAWIGDAATMPTGVAPAGTVVVFDTDDDTLFNDGSTTGVFSPVTGHATFIQGIVGGLGVDVSVVPVGESTVREFDLHKFANSTMVTDAVVNLSFGTRPCTDSVGEVLPIALASTMTRFQSDGAHAVVTAAGNEGLSTPVYPAALADPGIRAQIRDEATKALTFIEAIGNVDSTAAQAEVNALDMLADPASAGFIVSVGTDADFSNFGDWVTHRADGVNVDARFLEVGAYHFCAPTARMMDGSVVEAGQGNCFVPDYLGLPGPEVGSSPSGAMILEIPISTAPTATFSSHAIWSGTSFAAPIVAACIASNGGAGCQELLKP